MNTIFYIAIFIMGTVFGSFYTLAVYRIPRGEDITHTHSYCPRCEHKLGFWDLIPIWSYIFLGGKCRYCKEKIRPRYFILELISGIFFLIVAYLMNLKVENLTIVKLLDYSFLILYFTFIILMAGIDKERQEINRNVTAYGIIVSILYMIYLYIIGEASIYRYGIYLLAYIIILILDNITLKKHAINKYVYGVLITTIIMGILTNGYLVYLSVIIILLSISIDMIIDKIRNRRKLKKENKHEKIKFGYLLGVSNTICTIFALIYNYIFYQII